MHAFGAYHPNYTSIMNCSTSKHDVNPLYVMMYQWYDMVQPKPNLMHFLQNTATQVYIIYTSASDITHKLVHVPQTFESAVCGIGISTAMGRYQTYGCCGREVDFRVLQHVIVAQQ